MAGAIGKVGLEPLRPEQADEVLQYWQRAHPLHPLESWMLKERLFGPPPADPELLLAARGEGGALVGLAAGVYPCRKEGIGDVRWVGALPGPEWETVLRQLLDEMSVRLTTRGPGRFICSRRRRTISGRE